MKSNPYRPLPYVKLRHPEWSRSATIYELNTLRCGRPRTGPARHSRLGGQPQRLGQPARVEHPEWYAHDWQGRFRPTPWWDWSDIIDFDYRQEGLRRYMTDAMKYWVTEAGIDGYRCDVAGFVPLDFWSNVRHELDAIKPVFMLAEWESRDLHAEAFDATYAWSWNSAVHDIATSKADLNAPSCTTPGTRAPTLRTACA